MERIYGILQAQGAARVSSLSLSRVFAYETEAMGARRTRLPFAPSHALMAAFPFFAGHQPGNIPLYMRGADYVSANRERLERACIVLRALFPGRHFYPSGNAYPLPAVQAGRLAGLGNIGRHGLLIVPGFGTMVTLGAVLCDMELPEGAEGGYCGGCGACLRACPTRAIWEDASGRHFDKERCRSYLSQKKTLTAAGEALLRDSPWAGNCDDCQNACPENRAPRRSVLPEYTERLCANVDGSNLDALLQCHAGERKWELIPRNLAIASGKNGSGEAK